MTESTSRDVGMNTEWDPGAGLEAQATRIAELEGELLQVKKCLFHLENIAIMTEWSLSTPASRPIHMLQVSWPRSGLFTI